MIFDKDIVENSEYNFDNQWMSVKEILKTMKTEIPDLSIQELHKYIIRVNKEGQGADGINEILEPSEKMLADFFKNRINKRPYGEIDKIIHFCLKYRTHPSCLDETTVYSATGVSLKEVLKSIEEEEYELREKIIKNNNDIERANRENQEAEEEELKNKKKIFEEYLKKCNECFEMIIKMMSEKIVNNKQEEKMEKNLNIKF